MGQTYSFLEKEKKTWIEHNLQYDGPIRQENLKILKEFEKFNQGDTISLCFSESQWGSFSFQHWFVVREPYFIEFGSVNLDIYNARVTINTNPRKYNVYLTVPLSAEIVARISHVLGMCNYSLCLRNCEHVANYIIRSRWISSQMDSERGFIFQEFKSYLLKEQIRLVNTFPSCIRPYVFGGNQNPKKLYSFIKDNFVATKFDYYLDNEEDTYNILVVGPTGAGKSHLINVIFNEEICQSEVSHKSVTREIYFIRGRGEIFDFDKQRFTLKNVIVADTIGLCDTDWDEQTVFNMIKNRISSNFKYVDEVYIVFRADRLLKEHVVNIKRILTWLKYNEKRNRIRFKFIGTYADFIPEEKKNQLRKEATEIFELMTTGRESKSQDIRFESLIYTGFPPEEALNDLTKSRVNECWKSLMYNLQYPGKTKRIQIENDTLCTFV
jgi:hypothetical protein